MRRIMIVDDEFLVRIGIKSMLDWEEEGYVIVAEAVSGQDALKKIPACRPEIILTDLVMEPMDGLMLIAYCAEHYPDIQLVVLSNYNDFEKVKAAMKLGARDFFFKLTASPQELLTVLNALSAERQERRMPAREAEQLIVRNAGAIRRRLVRVLMESTYADEEELLRELSLIDVACDFRQPYCVMMVCPADIRLMNADEDSSLSMLSVSLESIVGEQFDALKAQTFRCDSEKCLVVINPDGGRFDEAFYGAVEERYARLMRTTRQYMDIEVLGALSGPCRDLKDFARAAAECVSGIVSAYSLSENRLVTPGRARGAQPFQWPESLPLSTWRSALHAVHMDAARAYLDAFFAQLYDRDLPIGAVREALFELYRALKADSAVKGILSDELTDARGLTLYPVIFEADRLKTAERSFSEVLARYAAECGKVGGRRLKREIFEVVTYVRGHLSDNLSIASAARLAHMSESYFSRLFKSEMGVGFVEFVNGARVEKARELLQRTDLRIGEIAAAVGIDNPNYFSILFKKQTGITPGEFRNSIITPD